MVPDEGRPVDLHAADLYLACACCVRVGGAVETLRGTYGRSIRSALIGIASSPAMADELEQQVYEELLLGRAGGAPKLESYAGQGPLERWLVVLAQRAALMALRSDANEARARDGAARARVESAVHAEVAFLKAKYRGEVDRALSQALANLTGRDRVVLQLHLVGGAGLAKIAEIYRVNPSTVSRWLARTRDAIAQQIREALQKELKISPAEVDSLMALVVSQLDVSLTQLLGSA